VGEFELPPDVRRLIASHIASVDHVDVLLLLRAAAPESLTAAEIVQKTGIAAALVDRTLTDLRDSGLVAEADGVDSFLYRPQSAALSEAVANLSTMYNERPVTLIRAVYDRGAHPAISFAEAFRIRGGDR
jgi:hypothetical protein